MVTIIFIIFVSNNNNMRKLLILLICLPMLNCKQLKEDIGVIGNASKETFDQTKKTESGLYEQKFDENDIVLINGDAYVVLRFHSNTNSYFVKSCKYDSKFYVNEKFLTHYLFR